MDDSVGVGSVTTLSSSSGSQTFGSLLWNNSDIAMSIESNESEIAEYFNKWVPAKLAVVVGPEYITCHLGKFREKACELIEEMGKVYGKTEPDRAEDEEMKNPSIPPSVSEKLCVEGRPVALPWFDECWYRGKILWVETDHPDGSMFEVQYVDHGNTRTVSLSDMRPLHVAFATVPCMAVIMRLEVCPPDGVTDYFKDVVSENLAERLGTIFERSTCDVWLTGGKFTAPEEEPAYIARISWNGEHRDISAELLVDKKRLGCVVDIGGSMGRVILEDPQPKLAYFDLDSVFKEKDELGQTLSEFCQNGRDIRDLLGVGDIVRVKYHSVAESDLLIYCSYVSVESRLTEDDYSCSYGVVTDIREGRFSRALTNISEHVVILPEVLSVGEEMMKKMWEVRKNPKLLEGIWMPAFCQKFSFCQTLDVTVIDIPAFLRNRVAAISSSGGRFPSCSGFVIRLEVTEVNEGIGTVKSHRDTGIVLGSLIKEDDLDVWVPNAVLGVDNTSDRGIRFPVGKRVSYKMCPELLCREHSYRAFRVEPIETSLGSTQRETQATVSKDTEGDLKKHIQEYQTEPIRKKKSKCGSDEDLMRFSSDSSSDEVDTSQTTERNRKAISQRSSDFLTNMWSWRLCGWALNASLILWRWISVFAQVLRQYQSAKKDSSYRSNTVMCTANGRYYPDV